MWHAVNHAAYWYNAEHQRHTAQDALAHFRDVVVPGGRVWVAVDGDAVVGVIAVSGTHVMQMAVAASHRRQGIASALLRTALANAPSVDRLYTFQRNTEARAFYERHGFVIEQLGVSAAPESEPDVLYRLPPIPGAWHGGAHNKRGA